MTEKDRKAADDARRKRGDMARQIIAAHKIGRVKKEKPQCAK